MAMRYDLLEQYDRQVPRYTSYPTAPHFDSAIDGDVYAEWLDRVAPDQVLSLYLHIPFCDTLCWFCGCNTKLVARYEPVAAYLDTLALEIDRVATALGPRRPVGHVHWGGGTPTILTPADIARLTDLLRDRFDITAEAEFAVEIDPRDVASDTIAALAGAGVTRASLGVQDVNADVQQAINRLQPLATTQAVVRDLRDHGIDALNIDLMYGLPHQTLDGIRRTIEAVLALQPNRLSLFGYAHVPWLKKHQRLIATEHLPGTRARAEQVELAGRLLTENDYVRIGLDHFARADDALAQAARAGRLNRNFQGYTTDQATTLIGLGASAIGSLAEGYVQNATPVHLWQQALETGRFATQKGRRLDDNDRLRRTIIERLMCDFTVDLDAICRRYQAAPAQFEPVIAALQPFARDGIVAIDGHRITVAEDMRVLVRTVAAHFDRYLAPAEARHARAV